MKVTLIMPYSPGHQAGGVQSVANNTIKGLHMIEDRLDKENIEIIVLSQMGDQYRLKQDKISEFISIYYYKPIVPRWLFGELQTIYNLFSLPTDIDLVHSHQISPVIGSTVLDYPTLFTIHGMVWKEKKFDSHFSGKLAKIALEKKLSINLRLTDEIISISPYVVEELNNKFELKSISFTQIENPVSESIYNLPINTSSDQILYPAAVQPGKNQLMFIKSLAELQQNGVDFNTVFAGGIKDKSYFSTLKSKIEEYDLGPSTKFLGHVPKNQIQQIFKNSSIVCLTSYQETAPMVISEAMASGTPVIATDVGGVYNMVSPAESGYLVGIGDNDSLTEKLSLLLSDQKLREEMGMKARSIAKRWKPKTIANQLVDKYIEYSNHENG